MKKLIPLALLALSGCAVDTLDPSDDDVIEVEESSSALVQEVNPSGDTYVSISQSSRNFGSETSLLVDGLGGARSLIRFDQAALRQLAGNRAVVSAQLEVTVTSTASLIGTPTLALHRMTTNWSESGATWAGVFGALDTGYDATPVATATLTDNRASGFVLDVTKEVVAMLGSSAHYGFMLRHNPGLSNLSVRFGSKESAVKPKLVINFSDGAPDPEPVSLTNPEPGLFVADASRGGVLNIPEHGLTFASRAAMVDYLVTTFGAARTTGDDGLPAATLVEVTYGQPVEVGPYLIQPVDDVVAALIGGKDGYITLAGQRVCVREEVCGEAVPEALRPLAAPGSKATKCSDLNLHCIRSESWRHQRTIPLANITLYSTIGSEVEQSKGGYKEERKFCWKGGWFPWACTVKSGSNRLTVNNLYATDGAIPAATYTVTKNNVTSLKQRLRGWFYTVKIDSNARIPVVPGGQCTAECKLTGVCGFTSSTSGGYGAEALTSKGDRVGFCVDGSGPL